MITPTLLTVWLVLIIAPLWLSLEHENHLGWVPWVLASMFWIAPIFSGVHVQNNQGQYKGHVTAVEQNGAIFKGWNVYLKTDLQSSNEDKACIDRENSELIERLKQAQENKESVVLEYKGVWQYAIGECPGTDWMIKKIR